MKKASLYNVVSKWFRDEILVPPIWKQYVPFELLDNYLKGIKVQKIYGVYVRSSVSKATRELFQLLPSDIEDLNVVKFYDSIKDSHLQFLPSSLKKLNCSSNKYITF